MNRQEQLESMAVGFVVCDDSLTKLEEINEGAELWYLFEDKPDEAVNQAEDILCGLQHAYYYGMLDAFRLQHPSVRYFDGMSLSKQEVEAIALMYPHHFTRNPLSLSLHALHNLSVMFVFDGGEITLAEKAYWGLVSLAIWEVIRNPEKGVDIR